MSTSPANLADQFLDQACVVYDDARGYDRGAAAALLAANPKVSEVDIWCAAATGHTAALTRLIDDDPSRVHLCGGPRHWPPLHYLCYSRVTPAGSAFDPPATAQVLLDRGADANMQAFFRLTPLTGVMGGGDNGPVRAPPHEHAMSLAELLLDHGADPNDSLAIYNIQLRPDDRWLKLLLRRGLNREHRSERDLGTLDDQLMYACESNFIDRVRLLLAHGADPNYRADYPRQTCYEMAVSRGNLEVAAILIEHGAEKIEPVAPRERFYNACMASDRTTVATLQDEFPEEVHQWIESDSWRLTWAAANNHLDAARLLFELGFEVRHALHLAAWYGHVEMVRLLLDAGVSPRSRSHWRQDTPAMFASDAGNKEILELLLEGNIDLFSVIAIDRPDRIRPILAADPDALERPIFDELPWGLREASWETPLAYAALRNHLESVAELLACGANPQLMSPWGQSLVDLVREEGHDAMADKLERSVR